MRRRFCVWLPVLYKIRRMTLLKIDQYLTAQESLASGYASLLRQGGEVVAIEKRLPQLNTKAK